MAVTTKPSTGLEAGPVAAEAPAAEPAQPAKNKLLIVASHGTLEAMWETLIVATTSAAMGQETSVFFTFWGLFPLVKNEVRLTGDNSMQKMLSTLNRGGISHLQTSKFNFMGMGPAMMRSLAKKYNVASPEELLEAATDMGVKLIPCQMTMDMMGLKDEDLIDGLEPPAGASTMLLAAQGAATFFI